RLYAGCRSGSIRASPELIPEEGSAPVLTSSNPLSTLLQRFACARLSQPCLLGSCPAFPQRSPPRLLTAAACGGLRSAPDCRTQRALLHLSYSCAPPFGLAMLVTHDPFRSWAVRLRRYDAREPLGGHFGHSIHVPWPPCR